MRTGALREAVTLEEIVEQDPTSALYLPYAERLLGRGLIAEAIRLCEERRSRPGSGIGDHIVLGRCYLADGRLSEARAEFQSALALDRENVVALKSLAGIFSHEGTHAAAADLYRAVCRVDPGDLESQTALHQITSGDFPEVRLPEVVVGQGDLSWQPIRLAREEDHLPELALGLRTLESHRSEPLRPAASSLETTRLAGTVAGPDSAAPPEPILTPEELDVGASFPSRPPATTTAPWRTDMIDRPTDPFQEPLGALDVEGFHASALERLDSALRPVEVLPLGEIESAAPEEGESRPRSAIWDEKPAASGARVHEEPAPAAARPPTPAQAAAPVPIPAPPVVPDDVVAGVKGNRAAFETWLRELGGGR
jgi:tetratricopeptide (TPR) repeat protein